MEKKEKRKRTDISNSLVMGLCVSGPFKKRFYLYRVELTQTECHTSLQKLEYIHIHVCMYMLDFSVCLLLKFGVGSCVLMRMGLILFEGNLRNVIGGVLNDLLDGLKCIAFT